MLAELAQRGIFDVGTWKYRGRRGITLGDPNTCFPQHVGPRYQIDITDGGDPELTDEEVLAIRRRFALYPLVGQNPPAAN
jgi:hypothetical protein